MRKKGNKRDKKGFLPYMTGVFQSLVCKCPCRRGCTKKCQDQAKRLFFCFFCLFIFRIIFCWQFFCCHLCLLVHWPQRYYCKFTRRAQSGLRPELELHLKALASSIAKPKRNALHSAVLLHGTMAGFCAVLLKKKLNLLF